MTTPPDAANTSLRWYVRTAGHRDPHCGGADHRWQSGGAVRVSFTPQPDLFEPGPLWLQSSADPARCCPACLTTGTPQPTTALTAANGATVAGLTETL